MKETKSNKSSETEVVEGEIVDESKQYRKFFAQLDSNSFEGLSSRTIITGLAFLGITVLLVAAIVGTVFWLIFNLLPFFVAFVLLLLAVGGLYYIFSYIYENFIKNIH